MDSLLAGCGMRKWFKLRGRKVNWIRGGKKSKTSKKWTGINGLGTKRKKEKKKERKKEILWEINEWKVEIIEKY